MARHAFRAFSNRRGLQRAKPATRPKLESLESRKMFAAVEYTQSFAPVEGYEIEWCTEGTDVRFRLTAQGTGWVAVGFNNVQRMPLTDIVMATGEGALSDTFADANAAPSVDTTQNVKLISAGQADGTTVVEFSRPIVTGDEESDYSLDTDRFLLWAFNERRDSFTSQHTDRGFSAAKIAFPSAGACKPIGGELPTLTIAESTIAEGDAGTKTMQFVVTLSAASTQPVTVKYATADGTAKAGEDYTSGSGTLTFTPGESLTQTVTVEVSGDVTNEADEDFTVTLSEPQGATIATASGKGTITNDDALPTLATVTVTLAETDADKASSVVVALSNASSFEVTVKYDFEAVTATANSDFRGTAGTLTFPAGSTSQFVNFTVVGDDQEEEAESFRIRLSSPTNATIRPGSEFALVEILDDDQAVVPHPWLNKELREDVNGSGTVEPADALAVINDLNRSGARALPLPPVAPFTPPPFLDVNGDDEVSPIDALLVINYLNQQAEEAARAARPVPLAENADASAVDLVLAQAEWDAQSDLRKKWTTE